MRGTRKALCTALLLTALTVPTLSGCGGIDDGPGAAAAQTGVVGEIVEQLKREGDQAESEELTTLREVRQEEHERSQEEEVEWH
jgi:hypothetical protein